MSGRSFLLGVVATVVVGAVVATLVVTSGIMDVSARPHGFLDRILLYASTRAIAHHSKDVRNPLANDPAALKKGLEAYRETCVECHGGPGAKREEFAAGLHPAPPDLAFPAVQAAFTDGMLYETISRGIDSTAMPAFGKTHSPDEIWSIVAFVRHLPALTPDERQELARRAPGEEREETPAPPPSAQGGAAGAAATGGAGEHAHEVSMSNFKFVPPKLEVHVGDTVEWKNADLVEHTATADDGTFDSGPIEGGKAKRIVVTKKGQYQYFCRFHPAMKGTLVVE